MSSSSRRKLQIFVSSTYNDLREDRQAAVSAILKAGHIPAGMELFNAGDRSQLETIKRWIDESDIFMLILGGRYGSIEPDSGMSYTEIEYDYAVSTGKPFFAVVVDEAALERRTREQGSSVRELHEPRKLEVFREKVMSRMCMFFENASDIKLAVHESIPELEQRHSLLGWVHASSVPDTNALINEINRLAREKTSLSDELKRVRSVFVGRRSVSRVDSEELRLLAIALAKRKLIIPFDVPRYAQDEVKLHGGAMYKALTAFHLWVRKAIPECDKFPKYSELGLFYLVAPKLAGGLSQLGLDYALVEKHVNNWSLENLISGALTGTYRIGVQGKKLAQMLSKQKRLLEEGKTT